MSILFHCTFPNEKKWLQSVRKKFNRHKVFTIKDKFNFNEIHYAIIWNLPDRILRKLVNLKVIFSLGAGVDHIINTPSYKNVPILRVKDPNMAKRMSYHVHSQILNYQLKLNLFQKAQLKKKWLGEMETLLNHEITIGILGVGFLGTAVGKYLKKMEYKVIGFKKSYSQSIKPFKLYNKKNINTFIKSCNIVVSILPSTKETENFIDLNFLKQMKKDALLINIGRGVSLNENHLLQHLNKNKNFYVSLDVFKKEPLPKTHKFWNHPNIIVTPHAAALTDIDSSINLMHSRYLAFVRAGKIKSDVDLKKGY